MTHHTKNIFDAIPKTLPKELFETLVENQHVTLERIISDGHTSPINEWYNEDRDEWVILLKGHARIEYDNGDELDLKAGDYLLIPAHTPHRVCWTNPTERCVWLAFHFSNTVS